MVSPRFVRRGLCLVGLPAASLSLALPALSAQSLRSSMASAQETQPLPSQAAPAATPVSPDTFPSIPAAEPVRQVPPATPPPSASSTQVAPDYQDPLEKPIVVAPGPPVPVQMAPPTAVASLPSVPAFDLQPEHIHQDALGSTYIPVDSPIYAMCLRLYSLGYLDTAFITMRPWTRRSLLHMLTESSPNIVADANPQAVDILAKLNTYLMAEVPAAHFTRGQVYGLETGYTRLMGVTGQTLRDSYHIGQTLNNDYGRPYHEGFNNITGFSTVNEMGRFSLYVRGEYQHAPAGPGYSLALASSLSVEDRIPFSGYNVPQSTIPYGNTGAQNPFRLQEAALSFHLLGHEISAGKSDAWLGPSYGSAMAWSDNAEDIYSFRINRVEPLHIPYLSAVLGPVRYDFFVGSLKGHTAPNSPWIHSEEFSFAPTSNFQFAFQRSVIWGGEGHEGITFGTFFRSFFSISDTTGPEKLSNKDPGARFSDFNFSYRLPFVRKYVTLTLDSICHDDVTPISAPRRAAYRAGLYLSQIPGLPKLDLRVEAVTTDPDSTRSYAGEFNYFEIVQLQGYTNKGFIMGDWIGREAKGGQAWLTYHLSGNEWVELEYLNKKNEKDFISGGTTQNQFKVDVVKRIRPDIELNAWLQYERWKAPIYRTGQQNDTVVAAQVTWYPKLHTRPDVGTR